MSSKELEAAEQAERAKELRQKPHILHPAGGLAEQFVYEPIAFGEYVCKTKEGEKSIVSVEIEFEDVENQKHPHWSIEIGGKRYYFVEKPPKQFLFNMPNRETVEKWVKGEKQSQTTQRLDHLNGVYLRTFLDFPHPFEFSVNQLFVRQTWLSELLSVVFYLGVKGEFGGGKTVTGEAIALICKHGYLTGNLSPPFVARSIQNQKLTLMVDELDSVAKTKDSDLNSIFRQGYRRGVKYSRVNPDTLETESYLIFGPKLFTVHSDIEEALQTRTIPIHVRETSKPEYPVVNLDKEAFSRLVYTENFLWYMDSILNLRDNELHLVNALADVSLDTLDILDSFSRELTTTFMEEQAEKIRKTMFKKKITLVTEGQASQVCQVTGRNVELMFMCFALSNLTKVECDDDIVKTFQQKIVEESERTELGYVGILREVLSTLWGDKQGKPEYTTEDGFLKISNKEIYDKYNETLKKEYGQGVSPAKFKEFMLEFGFTDALNRIKLEVPMPGDLKAKSRLCNIFTDRVLRKIGIEKVENKSVQEKLEQIKTWLQENKDGESLVDAAALTEKCRELGVDVQKTVKILSDEYCLFPVPRIGKWGVK